MVPSSLTYGNFPRRVVLELVLGVEISFVVVAQHFSYLFVSLVSRKVKFKMDDYSVLKFMVTGFAF